MIRYHCYDYSFFLLFLLLSFVDVHARDVKIRVSGVVTTPVGPAAYATVALVTALDSVQVAAVQSDVDGTFELEAKPGAYRLLIRFVGYETLSQTLVLVPGSQQVVLKKLALQPSSENLTEVVITSRRPAFDISNEKQVFDVSQSLVAKGGSVADALKQVPSLNVSPGGKVTLRNGTPVILVDGKRSLLKLEQIPCRPGTKR